MRDDLHPLLVRAVRRQRSAAIDWRQARALLSSHHAEGRRWGVALVACSANDYAAARAAYAEALAFIRPAPSTGDEP